MQLRNKANKEQARTRHASLLLFCMTLSLLLLSSLTSAQASFEHPGCSADRKSFCNIRTTCDLASSSCENEELSCDLCAPSTVTCADGSAATCQNTCQPSQFGLSAGCTQCVPRCSQGAAIPTVVLPFDVLILKQLDVAVAPEERNVLAGTEASFIARIKNRNPFRVTAQLSVDAPAGWTKSDARDVTLNANGETSITFSTTPPADAAQSTSAVTLAVFTPDIRAPFNFMSVDARVNVVAQQPFSVTIAEPSQQRVAGQMAEYQITITNNDPEGLPQSSFTLAASSLTGWTVSWSRSSLSIAAAQSATTSLRVTSPSSGEAGSYVVDFTVIRGAESGSYAVTYVLGLCGNNVCDVGEESSCTSDCPASPFICAGRCEESTDTGVDITTTLQDFTFTKFVTCKQGVSESQCMNAFDGGNCGPNAACLCGDRLDTACSFRCVDTKGAYYMLAKDVDNEQVKSTSYSYTCPYVNLPEIIQLRDDFASARDEYEQSRSVLEERLASGEAPEMLRPCYDGLAEIISVVSDHATYLDGVVRYPAVSNTTLARERTSVVRRQVRNLYNSYCRGARGLLVIDETRAPQSALAGTTAQASVDVKSMGIPYYGYAKCVVTSPQNVQTIYQDTCTQIGSMRTYAFSFVPDVVGEWHMSCSTYGSLDTQCAQASLHSEGEPQTFSVYTNEVFVAAVSGTCQANAALTCYVETNSPKQCASCRVGNIECAFVSQSGNRAEFACPAQTAFPGTKTLIGTVLRTPDCNPVAPVQKTGSVIC